MNWRLVVVVDPFVESFKASLFWLIRRSVVSLYVVNTGRITGFPQQQYQTPALSWMLAGYHGHS